MSSTNNKNYSFSLLKMVIGFGLMMMVLCATTANIINGQTNRSTILDFTGDGKTDWVVFSPSTTDGSYRFKVLGNQTGSAPSQPLIRVFNFGVISDSFSFDDYIGDRKTDLIVRRSGQPNRIFYVAQFPINGGDWMLDRAVRWGTEADGFAPGDYDGDGKTDYTAVRRIGDNLTWFILSSTTNTMRAVNFGNPALDHSSIHGADFTGDGRDELVVAANVNGIMTYYVGDAVTGAWLFTRQWGYATNFTEIDRNLLYPADYTGDGKADFVAVRKTGVNLIWYILDPATNTATATLWGYAQQSAGNQVDAPVRGDYDGDGRQDIAVYRFSNDTFYVLKSSDNGFIVQQWGEDGDYPASSFIPIIFVIG